MKLKLKKISLKDTIDGNYYICKNTFTNYVKKSNFNNSKSIYTGFAEQIQNISGHGKDYLVVKAIQIDKLGRIYVGGIFNKIGNLKCNNVAMWDGKKWNNLSNGLNGEIQSMCLDSDDNLYVGGSFSENVVYGNEQKVVSFNIIKWNGEKWVGMDGGVNSNITDIGKLSTGEIVVVGSFTKSITSETILQSIAKWDGSNWINLGADFLNLASIYALAITQNDLIYIGGYFGFNVSVLNTKTNVWTELEDANSNKLSQIINTITIDERTQNPIFGGAIGDFGSEDYPITNVHNVVKFDTKTSTWIPITSSNGFGLDSQCFKLYYNNIIASSV